MDRETFLTHLRESGLLSEQQLREVAGEVTATDSMEVANSLVSRGLLTPFQARRVREGQARGLVLGQYRLLEEAGQGGFGRVYKALHVVMGRVVAVKVISPQAAEDTRARGWFRREVHAATQLYHPNIVMAYDANEAEGLLFLVMEYVEGSDLESLVRRQGPLPISLACEMMRQAARALNYAAERGMVHRDVKPANLLIPRGGETPGPSGQPPALVKVVDFGLARLHRSAAGASFASQTENRFLGTPDYVSPEQVRNPSAVDVRSDLYSLGCTFYYALTGRKPFRGETVFEVVVKHLEEEPIPLEALRPEIPAGVSAVIHRLMAKDPARRFQTPAVLIEELDFLCGKEGAAPLVAPLRPPAEPLPKPAAGGGTVSWVPREDPPAEAAPGVTRVVPQFALETAPSRSASAVEAASEAPASGPGATARLASCAAEEALPASLSVTAVDPPLGMPHKPDPPAKEPLSGQAQEENSASSDPPSPAPDGVLRSRWRQWLAVVEALDQRGKVPMSEPAYLQLYRELLERCRAGARPQLRRMESLVEPWLAPQAFASADRDTLASLLACCRKLDQEVFGPGTAWGYWVCIALVIALVGVAVGLYQGSGGALPAKTTLTSLWRLIESHPVLSVVIGVPAVLLASLSLGWIRRPSAG